MMTATAAPNTLVHRKRPRHMVSRTLMTLLLIGFAVLMIVPFIWMVSASFKLERDVMTIPIQWIPKNPTWDNYKIVLHIDSTKKDFHFLLAYWNSIKVTVLSTSLSVITAVMAGYAFAKLRFPGSNILFIVYLAQMMVPSQLTLIPRFVLFSALDMTNTHFSIIAPKLIAVSATFMVRQAYLAVPNELRESAIWWQIMTPHIKPTIAALATVQFLDSWNSYLDPLIFLSDWRLRTLPIALNQFVSEEGKQYHLIAAACCLTVIPVFIVFLCGQKFFVKGLTVGAVKG